MCTCGSPEGVRVMLGFTMEAERASESMCTRGHVTPDVQTCSASEKGSSVELHQKFLLIVLNRGASMSSHIRSAATFTEIPQSRQLC